MIQVTQKHPFNAFVRESMAHIGILCFAVLPGMALKIGFFREQGFCPAGSCLSIQRLLFR